MHGFSTTTGWDPVTGFGSVDFKRFYDLLIDSVSPVRPVDPRDMHPDVFTTVMEYLLELYRNPAALARSILITGIILLLFIILCSCCSGCDSYPARGVSSSTSTTPSSGQYGSLRDCSDHHDHHHSSSNTGGPNLGTSSGYSGIEIPPNYAAQQRMRDATGGGGGRGGYNATPVVEEPLGSNRGGAYFYNTDDRGGFDNGNGNTAITGTGTGAGGAPSINSNTVFGGSGSGNTSISAPSWGAASRSGITSSVASSGNYYDAIGSGSRNSGIRSSSGISNSAGAGAGAGSGSGALNMGAIFGGKVVSSGVGDSGSLLSCGGSSDAEAGGAGHGNGDGDGAVSVGTVFGIGQ
jgi:hypothetical protein